MQLISFILSLFVVILPPSKFICESEPLNVTIYNNLNGDYQIAHDLENIDAGAFALIKWKGLSIMIPRTFNAGEISFSDRKWWWSYQDRENPLDIDHPRFRHLLQRGQIEDYSCFPDIDSA